MIATKRNLELPVETLIDFIECREVNRRGSTADILITESFQVKFNRLVLDMKTAIDRSHRMVGVGITLAKLTRAVQLE